MMEPTNTISIHDFCETLPLTGEGNGGQGSWGPFPGRKVVTSDPGAI